MSARVQLWSLLAVAMCGAACSGESGTRGLEEPFWVSDGSFKQGELPGAPPRDDQQPSRKLTLTTIETNNTVLYPGQTGKRIGGRATDDGYAVALRFEGLGDGYWVKPLGETDSAYPGELGFSVSLELSADLPLGPQRLLFSVIDKHGKAGQQQALDVCVAARFDRELHACDSTKRPPAAVLSLYWTSAADLDLIVRTPDGEIVDALHPSTQNDSDAVDASGRAVLYADRGASCGAGTSQREDLVWFDDVPPGRYRVFVNLFDACGAAATHFRVEASARSERDDGTFRFRAVTEPIAGELLADRANGGRDDGLLITSVELP